MPVLGDVMNSARVRCIEIVRVDSRQGTRCLERSSGKITPRSRTQTKTIDVFDRTTLFGGGHLEGLAASFDKAQTGLHRHGTSCGRRILMNEPATKKMRFDVVSSRPDPDASAARCKPATPALDTDPAGSDIDAA